MKIKARVLFSKHYTRTHYYDAIPSVEDGHPADLVVQRWEPHAPERRRILNLQEELLAALAPAVRPAFIELEELRNRFGAEREEAYFDLGVGYGIERERRRWRRLQKLAPVVGRLAARVRRSIERESLERDETVLALVEVLAEYAASSAAFRASREKRCCGCGPFGRAT